VQNYKLWMDLFVLSYFSVQFTTCSFWEWWHVGYFSAELWSMLLVIQVLQSWCTLTHFSVDDFSITGPNMKSSCRVIRSWIYTSCYYSSSWGGI